MRRRKQQEKELEASEELLLRARRRSIDGVVVNQRCVARPKKPKPGYGYPLGCHTIIMAWHGWLVICTEKTCVMDSGKMETRVHAPVIPFDELEPGTLGGVRV